MVEWVAGDAAVEAIIVLAGRVWAVSQVFRKGHFFLLVFRAFITC